MECSPTLQSHSSFLDEMRENSHPISALYLHISVPHLFLFIFISSPLLHYWGMLLKFIGRTLLRHNTEHFQRELLLLSNTKAGLGRLLNMTSFQINLPLAPQQIHANSPCIKSDRNIIFPRAGEPEQLGKTLI